MDGRQTKVTAVTPKTEFTCTVLSVRTLRKQKHLDHAGNIGNIAMLIDVSMLYVMLLYCYCVMLIICESYYVLALS